MKKYLTVISIIVGILALALILSGCSSNSGTPQATVTVTQEPTDTYEPPVRTDEDVFIDDMRSVDNWIIDGNTDSDLIDLGWMVCSVLDEGYTIEDIVYELIGSGTVASDAEIEFAATLIVAAVYDLCPEYSNQVDSY